ncbi:MAG TPA: IPT/TIG domain-containing protein [Terriglobia bacterium]|nr:IPT/TIG domain-containing protein [Terriglobia bacterium]
MVRNAAYRLPILVVCAVAAACAGAVSRSQNSNGKGNSSLAVISFSPGSGSQGTAVTIIGTGFLHTRDVAFNNATTASFAVVSDSQINVTVPASATTGPISVITVQSTASSSTAFTVAQTTSAPQISSFSPTSGPVGTSVTINGSSFSTASSVKFNGAAASFKANSDSQIVALVPSGAATGDLSVADSAGSAVSATAYTVTQSTTAPKISSFTPTSGSVGASVAISGSGFTGASSVAFNGTKAAFTVASDSQINTSVPSGATSGAISVSTSGGTATSSSSFTVSSGSTSLKSSGPISLNGQSNVTITGLHITSTSGNCVTLTNSSNITIEQSEIGPCAGDGIRISGGSSINIYDNYIHPDAPLHPCCDVADGVYANGTGGLTLWGNVIAYGEANIEVQNINTVKVIGNFLLNPRNTSNGSRGQNFQAYYNSSNVTVENNYALSSEDTTLYKYAANQEDSINFGQTTNIMVDNNYVEGGQSPSGCGIIADDAANSATFSSNILVNTGQCGIGIADGTNQVVSGNQVINKTPVSGAGNTAIYVWKQYSSACGPVSVDNNIAAEVKSDGSISSYWDGGGCGTPSLSNNTWGSTAVTDLTPPPPPPAIPPQPYACPAPSPYTTQSGCGR